MELKGILKDKRKQIGWTQEKLAEELLVTSKTVSNWETGKTFPDIESLIRIAKLYHLSLDNLLTEGSDVVKDIERKTRLNTLKKFMWFPSVLNIILIMIVSQQGIFGKLPTITTILLLVSIALNVIILSFFNREVKQEEQLSGISIHPSKRTQGFLLFVVLFLGAMLFGYLTKH
jgi:Predicted transcriptional regulators